MDSVKTVAEYLIDRLMDAGVRHVFGIPGDYVLKFYDQLSQSPLKVINTCDEQGAGFAADAYARIKGLGAVCVTYGVGALKLVNTTAQAYAERSPVVVISGAPGLAQQAGDPLLHHKAAGFDTQARIFEQITVAAAVLKNPHTAAREIDRAIGMARKMSRPVYLELPSDIVQAPVGKFEPWQDVEHYDEETLKEAVEEAKALLDKAECPVVLAGVELARFGLQKGFEDFLAQTGLPFATTVMGKSVVDETHPRFAGVFEGGMGREDVRQFVEESDGLLLLGAMLTDLNTGIFTARLDPARTIAATADGVRIRHHVYHDIPLGRFLQALQESDLKNRAQLACPACMTSTEAFAPQSGCAISVRRLFDCLNGFITDHHVVIADPGDALFGASDLVIRGKTEFLSSAYYASLGFAVPAAIGVQAAAPDKRPLVLVGDGAFQMTGMELTAAARYGLNPIILILNNGGYGTERPMIDGAFNDVHPWSFSELPRLLGSGRGWKVETETQLSQALEEASKNLEGFSLIDVTIPRGDYSAALKRLTDRLGKRTRG
jgi:TPP-dependent 2-oxoacid decarboxylase